MGHLNKFVAAILFGTFLSVHGAWVTEAPFYGQQYGTAGGARGLHVDPSGDLLVLSRNSNGILVFYEEQNPDGSIDVTKMQIIDGAGLNLNHGLAYNNGYIYASSTTNVYRWPFVPGQHEVVTTAAERVISDIPNGGHSTRTLIFDNENRLYISVGSNANIDPDSSRARIRRFSLIGLLPIPFSTGEVFADGLRNEVGLAWSNTGVLYGVENGGDALNRPDLGGDIHNGNPAEELNRFDKPVGTHYGYPYCFSSYNLEGYEAGTQFAWPTFMDDGVHSDAWCRDETNNQPPQLSMPAHQAPLGIDFYRGQSCADGAEGAFPCNMTGNAVVAFHGSWNSVIKVGYRVAMYTFNGDTPTGEDIDIIKDTNAPTCLLNCFRPVNAVFNNQGHLFVSTDTSGEIIKVTYGIPPRPVRINSVKF